MDLAAFCDGLFALFEESGLRFPEQGVYVRASNFDGATWRKLGDSFALDLKERWRVDPLPDGLIGRLKDTWVDGYVHRVEIDRRADAWVLTAFGEVDYGVAGVHPEKWSKTVPRAGRAAA